MSVDVRDARALSSALKGCQALISTVGTGTSGKPTALYSLAATNELRAMAENDIHRLEVISAAPAGPRNEQPWFARRTKAPPNGRSISYPDLAAALLDALGREDLRRKAVYVPN
jgi:hypothetical protein